MADSPKITLTICVTIVIVAIVVVGGLVLPEWRKQLAIRACANANPDQPQIFRNCVAMKGYLVDPL